MSNLIKKLDVDETVENYLKSIRNLKSLPKKIEYEYNCNKLNLSYKVSNSNIYISYFRGLDLGRKQSMQEHNREMDEECLNLMI